MCTAVASFIGPVMNLAMAGQQARLADQQRALADKQAQVERQMLLEQYAAQQKQYETTKKLALDSYALQQKQIDEQTVENVKEVQRQAFDQLVMARNVRGTTQATNATLGRSGVSVKDTIAAINAESGRNANRLSNRAKAMRRYGQALKEQARDETTGRIASVLEPQMSAAQVEAINVRREAAYIGAQQTQLQAFGTAIGAVTGFTNAFTNIQSLQSQRSTMQQSSAMTMTGLNNQMQYNAQNAALGTAITNVASRNLLNYNPYGRN